jgi:hypothetical protein
MVNKRRQFVLKVAPLAAAALVLPRIAPAQGLPALTETDPMAVALGFRLDTTKVDQAKFPKHTNGQMCASCLHFTKPGAEAARCDLFNKIVPKGGWCSGYSKRP